MRTYEKVAHPDSRGGLLDFQDSMGRIFQGEGKFRGVETPVGAML